MSVIPGEPPLEGQLPGCQTPWKHASPGRHPQRSAKDDVAFLDAPDCEEAWVAGTYLKDDT